MPREELPKSYDFVPVEGRWYEEWEKAGLFKADPAASGDPFCIVIPPPNVTGQLHMGHALNNTLQDILCRFERMRGKNVLWIPGTDHAGIATQAVVERELKKQGKTRLQIGREEFVKHVWGWREEYGERILVQLRRLGSSCDWTRTRFTLDEGLSRAVREVFVRLYKEGLLYKGKYMVNWSPLSRTAISDLEVEYRETKGHLWHIRYPLKGEAGKFLTVATTRPETMLGDTAVAVNPGDERYTGLVGKTLILPLLKREIPIIADSFVDPAFGSGAVKVTPAHDPNDYQMGKRHNLPLVQVIGEDGHITKDGGPYAGLDRFKAREKVVEDLQAQELLEKTEDHTHRVGFSQRSGEPIEPLVSDQWFVKTKPLAEVALGAVRSGKTKFYPKNWERTYFDWLENIEDWCVSRQLWWGHQIPAWYCDKGHVTVSTQDAKKCETCGSTNLKQDEDVLDTWFSSALWPFSTLGWPDGGSADLKKWYPTSVLVTGFDIIFFWVARMMMMGCKFMGEVPFKDVYIHALVRDEQGQKMSKSKGNVIDPVDIMNEYGTDSFRFTLAAMAAQGRDVKLSYARIDGYKKFVNKLWNAARFAMMNLGDEPLAAEKSASSSAVDKWILSEAAKTVTEATRALEAYEFDKAATAAYHFAWHTFCDWYLELAKSDLSGNNGPDKQRAARMTLTQVLDVLLRVLHPFVPFVTEEISSKLAARNGFLMKSAWPTAAEISADTQAAEAFGKVVEAIAAVRSVRGELGVKPSAKVHLWWSGEGAKALSPYKEHFSRLAGVSEFHDASEGRPPQSAAIAEPFELFVTFPEGLDVVAEKARLEKAKKKNAEELARVDKKLSNENFKKNAPEEEVEKQEEILAELRAEREKLEAAWKIVSAMG
ncbi:MAG: valine--tRNA ligase [Bdellovibrionota bacterium]